MLRERVAPQSEVIRAIVLEDSPCCEVPLCSALPRLWLTVRHCAALHARGQTVEIPAVTTFQASDDYGPPGQTGYYPTQHNDSVPATDGSKGCGFPCAFDSALPWARVE